MERNVTIKIPESQKPTFKVTVNGIDYEYPAGVETEVPESVASVIVNIYENTPKPLPIEDDDKEAVIEPLTVTENGEYTAPEGVDGYSPVNVNVQSGGGDTRLKGLIEGTLTELYDEDITSVGNYGLAYKTMDSVHLPNATTIGERSFYYANVKRISLPNVATISKYAFQNAQFEEIDISNVETIGDSAFGASSNSPLKGDLTLNELTKLGESALYNVALESVNFPKLTSLGTSCLRSCDNLKSVSMPLVETLNTGSMQECVALEDVHIPNMRKIGNAAFSGCSVLQKIESKYTGTGGEIVANAFNKCYSLKCLVLRSTNPFSLGNVNAFSNCYHFHGTVDATYNPNGDKDGWVYIPRDDIATYQTATNWTTLQFRAIEDYTVDGTLDGEMDWEKVGVTIE